MLTVITEAHQEKPQMSTKMSPSLQNTIPALEVKKKTQLMSRSVNLLSTYLQQFKWYPLPLVPLPLKTASQICRLPWPLLPRYNPILLLEEQACWEEDHLEEVEEAHQEEEEALQWEAMPTNQPVTQPEGKPMGVLLAVFEGDCSKAEGFLREFSIYLLVNHDVPALASFI